MKVLSALLFTLGLALIGLGTMGLTSNRAYENERFEYAWQFACENSRYSCKGVDRPSIYVTEILAPGARGVYLGRDTVIIDSHFANWDDAASLAVLIHEFVHYIQAQNNAYAGITEGLVRSQLEACVVEGEAHEVSNLYLGRVGRQDLAFDWKTRYGCVHPDVERRFQESLEGGKFPELHM